MSKYSKGQSIEIIVQAKPRQDGGVTSLLDIDVVKELLEFEFFLLNLTAPVPDPTKSDQVEIKVSEICESHRMVHWTIEQAIEQACLLDHNDPAYQQYQQYCDVPPKQWCQTTPRLLDFFYDRTTESWNLDGFETNEDII